MNLPRAPARGEIISLTISKEDKDSKMEGRGKFYSWKRGKKTADGIKYMKAWQATFKKIMGLKLI